MQDLKDAALADAGTGAANDDDNDLPDFFKMAMASGGAGDSRSLTGSRTGQGADTGAGEGLNMADSKTNSLFDPLTAFGSDAADANDLLASLGLPLDVGGQKAADGARGSSALGSLGNGSSGGVGNDGDGAFGDQSDWARMQKQFEDMNKSFLQE